VSSDRRRRRTRAWYLSVTLGCLFALLLVIAAVAQLILPGIAADRIADSLETHATGVRVSVSATPALELLFGRADHVSVHIDNLSPSAHHKGIGQLLNEISGTDQLDAVVQHALVGVLELQNIDLTKRGQQLVGHATVTQAAIENALPVALHIDATNPDVHTLLLRASTTIFGHTIAGTAAVKIEAGKLVIAPDNPLLAPLRLTLFSDSQLELTSISERSDGQRYTFAATARYL